MSVTMMDLNIPITIDNFEQVEIEQLALNKDKFGTLTFDLPYPKLEEMKDAFSDFKKLSYEQSLPNSQVNTVKIYFDQFIERLNWLRLFDPAQSGNVTGEKQSFEQQIEELYQQCFINVFPSLNYLRYKAITKNPKQQELAQLKADTQKARLEYEKIKKEMEEKIAKLESQKEEVSKTKGEIAAKTSGKHFERQAKEHSIEKEKWNKQREFYFKILLTVIIVNILLYIGFLIWGDINKLFNIPYGLLKIAIVAILSYAVSFASKNYRINCHLESVNMHRKNIAETLNDFIGSNPTPEDRSLMMQSAVSSMFQHLSTGYDNQDPKNDTGPAHEIIQFIPKGKRADRCLKKTSQKLDLRNLLTSGKKKSLRQ